MPEPLLLARGLVRRYHRGGTSDGGVDGVDLELERGAALGVVGASGAGKSTLARLLVAVEPADQGSVLFRGRPLTLDAACRPARRHLGLVLQDPATSLNPRLRVGTVVAEGLVSHRLGNRHERRRRVAEVLAEVGLDETLATRRPAELSGGERQRVAIARAIATRPALLVLDEPVTALDATVRGRVLTLLRELRDRHGLALIVISHDLRVVRRVCERTMVMLAGRVVEEGPTEQVLLRPAHPYTATLLAAVPRAAGHDAAAVTPATPTAVVPDACRWLPHCPRADDVCRREPDLAPVSDDHTTRCHHPTPPG